MVIPIRDYVVGCNAINVIGCVSMVSDLWVHIIRGLCAFITFVI